jgi:hypothetical protein
MRRLLTLSCAALRNFINIYLRCHPDVTDDDRRNMGLHVSSGSRTPVKPPDTAPDCEIIQKGRGMPGIIYRNPSPEGLPLRSFTCLSLKPGADDAAPPNSGALYSSFCY